MLTVFSLLWRKKKLIFLFPNQILWFSLNQEKKIPNNRSSRFRYNLFVSCSNKKIFFFFAFSDAIRTNFIIIKAATYIKWNIEFFEHLMWIWWNFFLSFFLSILLISSEWWMSEWNAGYNREFNDKYKSFFFIKNLTFALYDWCHISFQYF